MVELGLLHSDQMRAKVRQVRQEVWASLPEAADISTQVMLLSIGVIPLAVAAQRKERSKGDSLRTTQ